MPGLLGVATLQLHIEDAHSDFSHTCSSRVQPLPLVSPAGEKIGCITAAAMVVCCQPAALEQLERQASQDSVSATTARVSSNSRTAPAALQELGHHALVSALSVPAQQPAVLLHTVSAAVQTDAPHDTSSASSQPLQESVQQPFQPPQKLVQQEAGPAASSEGVSKDARSSWPPDCPYVVPSPHFHIYPPVPHTLHAAPSEQHAAQTPPVINISQPTFNFAVPKQVQAAPPPEPLPQTSPQTDTVMASVTDEIKRRLQEFQPDMVQGSTAVVGDIQTFRRVQAAVEQIAAPGETGQAAAAEPVHMLRAADDFESWRPVTSVPLSNGTAVPADRHGLGTAGSTAEAGAKSVTNWQLCSGAHALAFGEPRPCNHQVWCAVACHTCACILCHTASVPITKQKALYRGRSPH